tara:strand:- start:1055 stop:1900 length:846 start_codon:yes stop_codon:yes gene_type:complete
MLTFLKLGKLGRLGNQMFQIASTLGMAKKSGTKACFPRWEYQNFFKKPLLDLVVEPQIFGEEGKSDYRDMRPALNPNININVNGYFQSHLYFDYCRDEILSFFDLKEELINEINEKYPNANKSNSIHVRRGDYLLLEGYHPVQSMDYYHKAIDFIGRNEEYYIFSDDIEWCKENFKELNCTFIQYRKHDKEKIVTLDESKREAESRKYMKEDILELFLMSFCKNNIIANSSFSWWAAYLNKNKNKKVVAPKNWFTEDRVKVTYHDHENYLQHRIPASWKIM